MPSGLLARMASSPRDAPDHRAPVLPNGLGLFCAGSWSFADLLTARRALEQRRRRDRPFRQHLQEIEGVELADRMRQQVGPDAERPHLAHGLVDVDLGADLRQASAVAGPPIPAPPRRPGTRSGARM